MKTIGLLLAIVVAVPLLAQKGGVSATPYKQQKRTAVHSGQGVRGQVVFQQNCARCHTSPEGFSPRISQTVAMHMRVRANLSEADYQALLRFLNP